MSADERYVAIARVSNRGLAAAIVLPAMWQTFRSRRSGRLASLVGVVLLAVGVSTVRVLADENGLEVGFGPWGWPRRRIAAGRIEGARVGPTEAVRYGGYGYRIRGRDTRVIVRSAPMLIVDLVGGGTFGVTVPDAESFVRILERSSSSA